MFAQHYGGTKFAFHLCARLLLSTAALFSSVSRAVCAAGIAT